MTVLVHAGAAVGVRERIEPVLPRLWCVALDPLAPDRQSVVAEAWQTVCEAGAAGVLVPEQCGGQGQGLLEAVDLAATLSRAGAALPFLSGAVLAVRLLSAAGASSLLAEIACGDRVATVASGLHLGRELEGRSLTGRLPQVLHGSDADLWLVVVRDPSAALGVVLLDRPAHEVLPTVDVTRPAVQATLSQVPCDPLPFVSADAIQQAAREADIVRCAEVLGAAESLLDPDDRATGLRMRAAWAAVEQAAAVVDLDGSVPVRLVADVLHRTACVSRLVGARQGLAGVALWWAQRAGDAECWSPIG